MRRIARSLRPRRERPWRRAAEQCDELAPPHCLPPRLRNGARSGSNTHWKGRPDVRFGS